MKLFNIFIDFEILKFSFYLLLLQLFLPEEFLQSFFVHEMVLIYIKSKLSNKLIKLQVFRQQ